MEELFKNELKAGEELLWCGRPEKFTVLDATNKKNFIIKTAVSFAIALAFIIAYAVVAGGEGFKLGVALVILALAIIAPSNILMDSNKLQKRIVYGISNKRLFVYNENMKSVAFSAVRYAELKKDADGHTSLLCGADALKARAHDWRMLTVVGTRMNEENGECESFAFYAVPNAAKVKNILKDYLPL